MSGIRNLRRAIVAGGVSLVLVVAGYLGLAKLRGHGFHFDLPGRLGVDIRQTANGFTYSQSQKGHTLFTIHASKLVQYKGDEAELHDVTITLYGPEGSGRMDKIYGNDFLYDRKQGLARAVGKVQLDFASPPMESQPALQKPSVGQGEAASGPAAGSGPGTTIHVVTSGVTFNQASGVASTDQRTEFSFARASGSAVGATYDSRSGVLVLDHQVALLTTPEEGGPTTTVRAEHAQLLRDTHQAFLIKADVQYGDQHSTSDQATVKFRPDGAAQQVQARGHVLLTTADGAQVRCGSSLIDLDEQGQPRTAHLDGGLVYASDQDGESMQGNATEGTLTFINMPAARGASARGHDATVDTLHHAQFRDAVSFVVQRHALARDPNGSSTREMRASKLDIDFAAGAGGRTEAQRALAVGGAAVTMHDVPSQGPARATEVTGDKLLATLAGGRELKALDGYGHTSITDAAPDGATSTSTGDTLHVTFTASGAIESGGGARGQKAATSASAGHALPADAGLAGADHAQAHAAPSQMETAVQTGSVVITQLPAPGAKNADGSPPSQLHATAARAEYGAADQVLHLTGAPHLRNETLELAADKVDYHRDTGDAIAMGSVKSSYAQQPGKQAAAPTLGGEGPVHVVADHATMTRSSGMSVFYGTGTGAGMTLARMWQGANSVAAPVLELGRQQQTLEAHGAAGDRMPMVHATLGTRIESAGAPGQVPAGPAQTGAATPGASPTGTRPSAVVRVIGSTLHYSDRERRADLHGEVTAEQPSGRIHADDAQIFLTPAGKTSVLERIVAIGHVLITQPGRRGTGDRLVYTASDQRYVLTGTAQDRPRVADAERGTTTGTALSFRSADDSVEVSSSVDQGEAGPVGAAAGMKTSSRSRGEGQGRTLSGPAAAPGSGNRTVTDTHTPK